MHGQSLAGAGGGGFLCLLPRSRCQKEALEAVLAKTEVPVVEYANWQGQGALLWPTS